MKNINLNDMFSHKESTFGENEIFDVAVIGAGVVGCAIFKEFCQNGAKTLLVEKENDIMEGASKGNSGILHTGFDAPPESLELQCVKDGHSEFLRIKDTLKLPYLNTEALVVAWTDEQLAKLDAIIKKGFGNGIAELEIISNSQIAQREQNLSKNAKGAIVVKGESLIDPWNVPLAYVKAGVKAGGKVACSHEAQGGNFNGEYWEIKTPQKTIKAKTIINSAGLYGDIVEKIKGDVGFKIIPRKGQFIIFDETAYNLINSIILPVPTKITKGVVITKTSFGNILVGPTAEDQESRSDSTNHDETLQMLRDKAFDMLPALKNHKIIANFAGLRPASDKAHYRVDIDKDKNWITVGGIRSTGLTSALGLAKYIYKLNDKKYDKPKVKESAIDLQNITKFAPRDYQKVGYEKIICHCETVTDREIKKAITDEVSAGTMGGLKRRTKVTMGRCQGFNCLSAVAEICENMKGKK